MTAKISGFSANADGLWARELVIRRGSFLIEMDDVVGRSVPQDTASSIRNLLQSTCCHCVIWKVGG